MRFFARLFVLIALPCAALAQAWKPTKDVEFMIPFAVGGGADLMARVIHKIMVDEKLVPVPVALVNRPGGGGAAGIGYLAASRKGDPHTLILINGTTQISADHESEREDSRGEAGDEPVCDDFLFSIARRRAAKSLGDFIKDTEIVAKSMAFSVSGTTDTMAVTVLSKATGVQYNIVSFNRRRSAHRAAWRPCAGLDGGRSSSWPAQGARCARSASCATAASPRCPTCLPSRSKASPRPTSKCGAAWR